MNLKQCDTNCGAIGLVTVTKGDSDLVFCGHHFDEHKVMLMLWTDNIEDSRVVKDEDDE